MEHEVRLLLDTHALIWWLSGDEALSMLARAAVENTANDVFVSAASAMEISTKFRIGKLSNAAALAKDFESIVASQGFHELPISVRHARMAGEMNIEHKDPFDRFQIAQSIADDLHLVSNEVLFDNFAVKRLW